MTMPPLAPPDAIAARFLAENEQSAEDVAGWFVAFIRGAQQSLDFAIYDFRLSAPLRARLADALDERARAGVRIRIAYDHDRDVRTNISEGVDPAPNGTPEFVQALGFPSRGIDGMKLMHHKYILRDSALPSAAVWTGSTNLTDDAWTLQENNVLELRSVEAAAYYAQDFAELWTTGEIGVSGEFATRPVALPYGGALASVQLLFSPGSGPAIDYEVGRRVAAARRRVRVCSMLLNSSALLSALSDHLRFADVAVDGVYDATQMDEVLLQWRDVPHNHWKIDAVQAIIADARLVGKNSTPYAPEARHDFMHNKILVVDDTVITGSYNFSRSAELNAENILLIDSPALAAQYSAYIDHLLRKYDASA